MYMLASFRIQTWMKLLYFLQMHEDVWHQQKPADIVYGFRTLVNPLVSWRPYLPLHFSDYFSNARVYLLRLRSRDTDP